MYEGEGDEIDRGREGGHKLAETSGRVFTHRRGDEHTQAQSYLIIYKKRRTQ